MSGKYPNTFYRVAVKALVKNEAGEILLVKEKSDKWDLPGGGLDHGETPADGIKRELLEEVGVSDGIHVGNVVDQKAFYIDEKQIWLMWNVYEVGLLSYDFKPGDGVTDIHFIDPKSFQDSDDERERYLAHYA